MTKKTKSAENSQPKSRQGYMDATDFFHELGEALGGNTMYSKLWTRHQF